MLAYSSSTEIDCQIFEQWVGVTTWGILSLRLEKFIWYLLAGLSL
jgi:hypothetical protein